MARWLVWLLIGLSALCCGVPAGAQTFGPPVATELVLVLLDREGNVRLTLAGYYAGWQNPLRGTVITTVGSGSRREQIQERVTLPSETPVSPLFEATYVLSRRWSVGLWYNPIRNERWQQTVTIQRRAQVFVNVERDVDLGDLHVTYYGPRGLSGQIGYYREHGAFRLNRAPEIYTRVGWNLWLNQRLDLLFRNRLTTERLGRRLMIQFVPFVSVGYHASRDLHHSASVLAGLGVTFNDRISLSGSVWLFDLAHPSTRITGGLVIRR